MEIGEGLYYITIKKNNEFQINHYWEYEDQRPQESLEKVNKWLSENGRGRISVNSYNSYEEANNVLNNLVPYNSDGLVIDYELRKYYKHLMPQEKKEELNEIINKYIEESAKKQYEAASREGLKIKINQAIKKI